MSFKKKRQILEAYSKFPSMSPHVFFDIKNLVFFFYVAEDIPTLSARLARHVQNIHGNREGDTILARSAPALSSRGSGRGILA